MAAKAKSDEADKVRKAAEDLAERIAKGYTTQDQEAKKAKDLAVRNEQLRVEKEAEQARKKEERKAKGENEPPARTPRRVTDYSSDIELLSKNKVRFSSESFVRVTAVPDLFVHELVKFAMNNVTKEKKSIVQKRHVLENGYNDLLLSSLYRDLPVFKKALVEEVQRQKLELANAELKKAERKAKQAASAAVNAAAKTNIPGTNVLATVSSSPSPSSVTQTVVLVKSTPVVKDKPVGGPAGFDHYVKLICNNVINEEGLLHPEGKNPFSEIRISDEFKTFMSTLIIEFLQKLAPLLKGELAAQQLKTISVDVVKHTISFMLICLGVDPTNVEHSLSAKIDCHYKAQENKSAEPAAAENDSAEPEAAAGDEEENGDNV
jgi:hypothetical protein